MVRDNGRDDDVVEFELCVVLIVAVSVTVHALFAWKSIFHQAWGAVCGTWGKILSGLGYGGYAVGVVVV